jgi:hypothetical protein
MSRRTIKLAVVAAVAVAVLVLSPWSAWFGDDAFDYGLPEVRAAVEGTWQLTVSPPGGPAHTTTFTLAQGRDVAQTHAARALVQPAAACGTRSLVRPAGACVDMTTMPLDIQVAGAPKPEAEQGLFLVFGTTFRSGELHVALDGVTVSAMISPRGTVERATVHAPQAVDGQPATLVRIRP